MSRLRFAPVFFAILLSVMSLAPSAFCSPVVQHYSNTSGSTPPAPTITGLLAVGEKLTASAGDWGSLNYSFRYQWKRNGKSISGATKKTYVAQNQDKGKVISVSVVGSGRGLITKTALSSASLILAKFSQTVAPTISGATRVGSTLTAYVSDWTPHVQNWEYQWLADGQAIPGATGATYSVTAEELGKQIQVAVTANSVGYLSKTLQSNNFGDLLGAERLTANQVLNAGEFLNSLNGKYKLQMQADGNLVETDDTLKVLWSSGTSGSNHLIFQDDGNLVIRDSSNTPIWSTNTYGSSSTEAVLQDDGNFVIYAGSKAQWSRGVVGYAVVKASGGTQGMTSSNLSSTQLTTYPYNRTLGVVCYVYGQNVRGYYGWGTLWHLLVDGNYASDVDLNTGVNGPMPFEPQCGGSAQVTSLESFVTKYNGQLMVANLESAYAGQCVSLITQYLSQLYGISAIRWGNAVDWRFGAGGGNRMQASGFTWSTDRNFSNGDVLVWGSGFGHIGIWYNGQVFDQNDARNRRPIASNGTYGVGFANYWSTNYLGRWHHN